MYLLYVESDLVSKKLDPGSSSEPCGGTKLKLDSLMKTLSPLHISCAMVNTTNTSVCAPASFGSKEREELKNGESLGP